jgi:superfamily I DNA and/or RNA helicase
MGGEKRRGTSWIRDVEAEKVADIASAIVGTDDSISVGVITFYSAQRDAIFSALKNKGVCRRTDEGWEYESEFRTTSKGDERIRVGSVDAFQGKEFDVVILSMTRSNQFTGLKEEQLKQKYGFLQKPERLNVAFSRAKKVLIAVGDRSMFSSAEAQEALPSVYKYSTFLCGDSK